MRTTPLGLLLLSLAGCGDSDDGLTCGPGTRAENGQCVPDTTGPDARIQPDAPTVPPNAKRVFVTKTTYTGDVDGLVGANALCQNAATAATLGGTWAAWLSDFNTDAIDRITSTGPWYLLTGEMAFANKAALATSPAVGIDVQEDGTRLVIGERVWTGTRAGGTTDGSGASQLCGEWFSIGGTGTIGNTSLTDGGWTDAETLACTTAARLYCFQL